MAFGRTVGTPQMASRSTLAVLNNRALDVATALQVLLGLASHAATVQTSRAAVWRALRRALRLWSR